MKIQLKCLVITRLRVIVIRQIEGWIRGWRCCALMVCGGKQRMGVGWVGSQSIVCPWLSVHQSPHQVLMFRDSISYNKLKVQITREDWNATPRRFYIYLAAEAKNAIVDAFQKSKLLDSCNDTPRPPTDTLTLSNPAWFNTLINSVTAWSVVAEEDWGDTSGSKTFGDEGDGKATATRPSQLWWKSLCAGNSTYSVQFGVSNS